MKTLSALVCAGAILVTAGAASAASVNFATGKNWSSSGHTYGDVSVKGATASDDGRILTNDEYVASWGGSNGGIGIASESYVTYGHRDSSYYGRPVDQHTIDGHRKNELAMVDFGAATVELASVTFNYWDRHDAFNVGIFDSLTVGSKGTPYYQDVDWGWNSSSKTFYFKPGTLVGSIFGFGADDASDNFKLASISYREVAAVPLPAGAVLLLSGLVGFGALRRRQKAA